MGVARAERGRSRGEIVRCRLTFSIACLTAVLVVGCAKPRPPPAAPTSEATDDPAIGKPAPGIPMQALDGKGTITIESLRGQIVVAHFWSSQNEQCKKTLSVLESL